MGMKCKYDTYVKPRWSEIEQWVCEGATDHEIMKALNISEATFYKYIKDYPEFDKLIHDGRKSRVVNLKNTLFKKAIGFTYDEVKLITDQDGNVRKEVTTKTCLPSESALLILLKHWDKNEDGLPKWFSDPATFELKKAEFEFKKESFKKEDW